MNIDYTSTAKKKHSSFILALVGLFGLLLNQSSVLFGINISLADFVLILLVLLWMINQAFNIPVFSLLVFGFFTIIITVNSVFVIPFKNDFQILYSSIAKDYLKVLVIFLYFLLGHQLAKKQLTKTVLTSFLAGSVIIGGLGFLSHFLYLPFLSEIMLYDGVRLKGFMNDPNYFSVLQCIAAISAVRLTQKHILLKSVCITILLLSIVHSASKTGFMTLILSILYCLYHSLKEGNIGFKKFIGILTTLLVFLASLPFILFIFQDVLKFISSLFPIFERVQMLFTDIENAFLDNGSGRGSVWETAWSISKSQPLFGVGIGNYSELAFRLSKDPNVAHNTYLQVSAEWGIPMASLLIFYSTYVTFSSKFDSDEKEICLIVKEISFIFLVSSMSISFNNSRLFWLFLGIGTAHCSIKSIHRKEKKTCTSQ